MLIRRNLLWVSNTDFCSVNTVLDFVCEFSPWKGSKLDLKSEYLPYLGRVNMVKSKYTQNLHKIFLKVGLKSWYQSANKPFLYLLFLFLWTSVSFHLCLLLHFIHQYLTLSSSIYLYLLLSYLLSTLIYFDLLLSTSIYLYLHPLLSYLLHLFLPLYASTFRHTCLCATLYPSKCLHATVKQFSSSFWPQPWVSILLTSIPIYPSFHN